MIPGLTTSLLAVMAQPALAELEALRLEVPLARVASELKRSLAEIGAKSGPVVQPGGSVWCDVIGKGDEPLQVMAQRGEDGAVWITYSQPGTAHERLCA